MLSGYNTENYFGENDFSIRTLWNPATKIYTVGWYNLKSGRSTDSIAEVNLEIQFNMNDDSFRIVHGKLGDKFPTAPIMLQPTNKIILQGSAKTYPV